MNVTAIHHCVADDISPLFLQFALTHLFQGGTLFSLLQKMEPVIIKEMERSKKAHRESSQTLKFECVLEHEAKKKLKHSDDKKKFIKKFETDFAAAFA